MTTLHVINDSPLIGDALGSYPIMLRFAQEATVHVTGDFNPLVKDFVEAPELRFNEPPRADKVIRLSPTLAFTHAGAHGINIAQGYFRHFGFAVPPLPITLPLKSAPIEERADIVIAPFARSDLTHVRRWPQDRWQRLIAYFAPRYSVYILGGGDDELSWATAHGAKPFFDRPLAEVHTLLQTSRINVTVDTGIGHICNFGNIKNHIVIHPADCRWLSFAHAKVVAKPRVQDITAAELIAEVEAFL